MILNRADLRVLSPFGDPEGAGLLLDGLSLPERLFIQAPSNHQALPCFQRLNKQ